MAENWALALHGGAGPLRPRDHAGAEAHMAELLREGQTRLARGDAVITWPGAGLPRMRSGNGSLMRRSWTGGPAMRAQ